MLLALAAAWIAVIAWGYLLVGHGWFWRTDQRLPPDCRPRQADWPSVVAVVPARDEAEVLPATLPDLLTQDYPGEFGVVLVDDESTDGTARVASGIAAGLDCAGHAAARLTVLHGQPLPDGWAGKVWAMHQGLEAAQDADYVLFTDADIALRPGTLRALVRAAQGRGLALVSQMAQLRSETVAERLLIPAFVYFFAQLYPFRRVNKPGTRTAAAAGGCMLVRRLALEAAGGLEPIAGARIDDVALGGLLKRGPAGGDCWLGFTIDVVSRRRYSGMAEIWDMVARSAYTQLRYSPVALAATVLGMAWLYLLPAVASVAGLVLVARGPVPPAQATSLALAGLAAWAIMAVTYVPVLRLSGLSPVRAPYLPLIAVLYTAMTVSSAWRHWLGRGGAWKGRTIKVC